MSISEECRKLFTSVYMLLGACDKVVRDLPPVLYFKWSLPKAANAKQDAVADDAEVLESDDGDQA